MVTDWMQAWADVAQAGIVVISIAAAGWKYFVTRKNRARNAVVQMFNLADEFPNIASDKARYRLLLAQQKQALAMAKNLSYDEHIDEPNWDEMRDEVRNFRESFRDTLQTLWSALDDTSWGWKKYQKTTQDVLNTASNVEQSISTLLDTLSGDDHSKVQQAKQSLARFLERFTHSLATLAEHKNIMSTDEAEAYDPVLREYIKMPMVIKKNLQAELDAMKETNDTDQLQKITQAFDNPDSSPNLHALSDEAKAELTKLAAKHLLISFRLNKLNDQFQAWIPEQDISQARRAMYASLNPYISQETETAEWVADNLDKLCTQMVHDELHKYALMQYSSGFAVQRALLKKDGHLSKSKALAYNIVGADFAKFLSKYPQVTVEDILPSLK